MTHTPHNVPFVLGPAGPAGPVPPVRPPGVWIAEIRVDDDLIHTPAGTMDRRGAHWLLGAATPVSESCPTWAVVLAFLLMPCTGFLSLLLLLVKEPDSWYSALRVTDGRITFDTTIYSRSSAEYASISNAVAWARTPQAPGGPRPLALPGP